MKNLENYEQGGKFLSLLNQEERNNIYLNIYQVLDIKTKLFFLIELTIILKLRKYIKIGRVNMETQTNIHE